MSNVVVVVVCFHDLMFCLSSQLKAASCARCSSEMPLSKQVNGQSLCQINSVVVLKSWHNVGNCEAHVPTITPMDGRFNKIAEKWHATRDRECIVPRVNRNTT